MNGNDARAHSWRFLSDGDSVSIVWPAQLRKAIAGSLMLGVLETLFLYVGLGVLWYGGTGSAEVIGGFAFGVAGVLILAAIHYLLLAATLGTSISVDRRDAQLQVKRFPRTITRRLSDLRYVALSPAHKRVPLEAEPSARNDACVSFVFGRGRNVRFVVASDKHSDAAEDFLNVWFDLAAVLDDLLVVPVILTPDVSAGFADPQYDEEWVDWLRQQAIGAPDAATRFSAVTRLGWTGNPKSLPELQRIAEGDASARVRRAAKQAVERIQGGAGGAQSGA